MPAHDLHRRLVDDVLRNGPEHVRRTHHADRCAPAREDTVGLRDHSGLRVRLTHDIRAALDALTEVDLRRGAHDITHARLVEHIER